MKSTKAAVKPAPKKAGPASSAPKEVKPEYKRTPEEQAAWDAFRAERDKKPTARLKVKKSASGSADVGTDHEDAATGQILLMRAIGSTDFDFSYNLVNQIVNASSKGQEASELGSNFALSVIKGIEPRDQIEAMLAAQMAAVHTASMMYARRLNHTDTIAQSEAAMNGFTKLTRTFTAQMEALKRYRSTGQQKVTVEHVTVQAGGQAIVGNVSHGTPANDHGRPSPVPRAAIAAPNETPLQPGEGVGAQVKVRATP